MSHDILEKMKQIYKMNTSLTGVCMKCDIE